MATSVYLRVSSESQADANGTDSQRAKVQHWLAGESIPPESVTWWEDLAVSGSTMSRPQWDAMIENIQPGDTIVVPDLTRAGRTLNGLSEWAKSMESKGVRLVFIREGFDTRTAVGKLLFGILASVAEFELDSIRERIRGGVRRSVASRNGAWGGALARRGIKGGPKLTPDQIQSMAKDRAEGMAPRELAAKYGVHRNTVSKYTKPARS